MALTSAIAERIVGAYPLSIATSLAIESANGVHPEIQVDRPPILSYPFLYVNIRTLIRNMVGSLDRNAVSSLVPAEITDTVAGEMEMLVSIVREVAPRTQVVFYLSQYANIKDHYKFGTLRVDTTPKQHDYTNLVNIALQDLIHTVGDQIQMFELKLTPVHTPRALILTHYAFDLLSYPAFSRLTLLESHTGTLKERAQWYSKYHEGRQLSMIPFRDDFIQVFGDSEIFRPADIRLRRELIDVATKYHWSAITTRDKIAYGIGQMATPEFRETMRAILV